MHFETKYSRTVAKILHDNKMVLVTQFLRQVMLKYKLQNHLKPRNATHKGRFAKHGLAFFNQQTYLRPN